MGKVIGIDLGTTNSCVAVMEGGEPVVIPNSEGNRTTPSVVSFKADGTRIVGQAAKRLAVAQPDKTVISIKRHMGENYKVNIEKGYSPQEISAMILSKLKADAESYLGTKVTDAVITCPAYFNDSQRQATKDAGKIAGLNVLRIINEPTAAALAYGLDKQEGSQKVMIYDLGGGTFDVSILEIGDGVFEVLATNGDTHLGGDDFDNKIIEYLVDTFRKETGVDLSKDRAAMQRLKEAAEKAKIELSGMTNTNINLPFITVVDGQPQHLDIDLSRQKFDNLTSELVDRTVEPMKKAMADAGLTYSDIKKVILVGGSTRVPAVFNKVKEITGKEPFKGINPDECVAIGAAVQAGELGGEVKDLLLLDVTPLSLGIETLGGVFNRIIDRNTTIPVQKSQVYSTAADGQTSVEIHVLQGERDMAAYNTTLGRFVLDGIAPAPRGVPQIEVTFDIDANGIVNVTAKDKGTGKEQHITIQSSSNMSKEDIEKAVRDAEMHASEDKKAKEAAEAKNAADNAIFQSEKTLGELGDKVTEAEKQPVRDAIEKLKKTKDGGDTEAIKADTEALQKAFYDISAKLYQQQQQSGGQSDNGGSNGGGMGDDGVYNAEFTDKTDDSGK